jgi:hypothetical protein
MPILLRKMVRKAEENFKQHTNQQQQEPTNTSKTKFENPKSKKELGEYIDYEEVD